MSRRSVMVLVDVVAPSDFACGDCSRPRGARCTCAHGHRLLPPGRYHSARWASVRRFRELTRATGGAS